MRGNPVFLINFIALSLLAHGLLLLIEIQSPNFPVHTPLGYPWLSISLSTADENTYQDSTSTSPDSEKIHSVLNQKNNSLKVESKADQNPDVNNKSNLSDAAIQISASISPEIILHHSSAGTSQNTSTEKNSSATQSKPSFLSEARINKTAQQNFTLGEVQNHLSRYLIYPKRARRRGWEGEVMVGFKVNSQGFLSNIHLTQTSGYSLLDSAALTALEKVKNIPLSQWSGNFLPITMEFPVIYRLTNG